MRDVTGAFAHLLGNASCRVCGCTEHDACLHPDGRSCSWVAADLCSVCANTIGEIMITIPVSDREAEAALRVLLKHEVARRGMSAPAFRRQANGPARPAA